MSNFEKLAAMGAEVVGGDLIFKHKVLGHFRNGDLHMTEDGQKMLEIDDAVVKEDVKPAKPAAKTAPRKRAAAATEVVEPSAGVTPAADEPEIDLGDE